MKKILLGITVLLLVFTLSSCKSDSGVINPLDDIMANNPTLVYRDSNVEPLKVGMTLQYPPFETIDINGDPIGISVDMAYELGMFLEREVEIVDLPWASLIPAINTGEIDYDGLREMALKHKPKIILACFSAYSRELDYEKFVAIAKEVGAYTVADVAHIAGLIASGVLKNPFELSISV